MKKRLVALLLVFSLSACLCVSAFAADTGIDIIDDPLSYYFQNQLLGVQKGTGVTLVCPNGDYKTLYTGGTLVTCPYDGEALELASEGGVTAKKAPSGVGRKDLPGYQSSDNNPGVPSISQDGNIALLAKYRFTNNQKQLVDSFSKQVGNDIWNFGENSLYIERYSNSQTYCYTYGGYILDTNNIPGIYYIPAGTSYVFNPWGDSYKRNLNKRQWPEIVSKSIASVSSNGTKRYICIYKYNADRSSQGHPDMSLSVGDGTDNIFQQDSGYTISTSGNITIPYPKDLVVYLRPTSTNIVKNTNITIEIILRPKDKTAAETARCLRYLKHIFGRDYNKIFKTITCDNGSEFADQQAFERVGSMFFYCHPSCPSERGSNENANILIRRKLPKGQSMKNVTQKQATQIQHWLNDYPRHIFDGKTAFEMFMQELPAMNLHNPKRIVNFFDPHP